MFRSVVIVCNLCSNMNITRIVLFYCWIFLRSLVNANICSYTENAESICCEGWSKNVYGDCIKSECFQDCGYGKCVGLNICECFDRTTRSDSCPYPKEKSCPDNCSNRGKCKDWTCVCDSGYTGLNCNSTMISTCYLKVNRGLCKSTPDGLQLTKEECCSIFQMAWGNPCEFCNGMNTCGKGYIMKNGGCEDIDECQLKGICLNGECINERGSFRCQCPPQYVLNEDTMACQQYKEICELYSSNCGLYGSCVPLITGDYKCVCREPYEASEDGKKCIKHRSYNVCKMFTKLCQPHGDCQPSGLTYYCKCQHGFVQSHDRKSCRINLVSSNTNNEDLCRNPEVSRRCISGQCISDSSTYRCVCYPPYKVSNDMQDCTLNQVTDASVNRYCQRYEYYSQCQGGQCVDTYNGYYCKCTPGYISTDNGRRCERQDSNGNNGRNPNESNVYCRDKAYFSRCKGGRCIGDSNYGFKCICLPGFIAAQDGRACYPVSNDPCSNNGFRCVSGSCRSISDNDFRCDCPAHLVRSEDGRSCVVGTQTTATVTTYCDMPGYRERCGTGQCQPDSYYGFKCICAPGYKASGDGRACYKITSDPCRENGHRCLTGRCRTQGESDYQCDCPQHLSASKDGRSCSPTNAVTTRPTSTYCDYASYRDRCSVGQCVPDNYYGFKCVCPTGYKSPQDGRACYKIENSESICSKYQSNCMGGNCIELGNNEYECQCNQGYQKSSDGRYCVKDRRSVCDTYGFKCLTGVCYARGDQSYFCLCADGYSAIDDSTACAKNNFESICSKYQTNCQGGQCVELRNSDYECICGQGYHRSNDGRSCIKDVRSLCDTYGHKCRTGVCYSRGDQDYFCLCAAGYTVAENSKACEKSTFEEKCSQYKDRCQDGFCFDIQHGYLCVCSSNYIVSEDGKYCTQQEMVILKTQYPVDTPILGSLDIKDCTDTSVKEACLPGTCVNNPQGHTCVCPYSYTLNADGTRCQRDISKCQHCYNGCTGGDQGSVCMCPPEYNDLFQSGICIKNQDSLQYTLTEWHCDADSKFNRTFVVRFNVPPENDKTSQISVFQNIANIIQPKQSQSAKLNFCVPITKRHNSQKRGLRNISQDLSLWRVVCIFDC